MAINRVRQTGSAFTAWAFIGGASKQSTFILCQEVAHRSPQPIAPAVEVHPLNYVRPTEIIVPRAITHGEITLTIMESFDKSVYDQLGLNLPTSGAGKINDLADLFNWMMTNPTATGEDGSKIKLVRVIRDPIPSNGFRTKEFLGARIVDVREDETTRVDSTINPLQISVWYTRMIDTATTPVLTPDDADVYDGSGSIKDAPWGL
jgi:hypothetical protein